MKSVAKKIYQRIMQFNEFIEMVYGVVLLTLSYVISSFVIFTIKPILAGFFWAMQQEGYVHTRKWYEFKTKEKNNGII